MAGECEWYQECLNTLGKFAPKRCPTNSSGVRQIFNPETKSCTDKTKLAIDGRCRFYKECLLDEFVSPFSKWVEKTCGVDQQFHAEKYECIALNNSSCRNIFS